MGEIIAENSKGKNIYIATHSVEILKGILSKCSDVNIIRITQPEEGKNSIEILEHELLKSIITEPLLRVTRVLEGIFCDEVVITESEADELVYQELIEKIQPESGLSFAHGQNKQTLATIAKFYKEIGVNHHVVLDFDIIRDSNEFGKFLALTSIEDSEKSKIISYSNRLREIVNTSVNIDGLTNDEAERARKDKRDEVYHKQGINFFDEEMQLKINQTFDELETYNIHILRTGELETILKEYDVEYSEKKKWIVDAIEKIESLNSSEINKDGELYRFLNKIVNKNR